MSMKNAAPAKPPSLSWILRQLKVAFILIAIASVLDWACGDRKDGPGQYLGALGDGLRAGTPQLQPIGMATEFLTRLAQSEYGWKFLSWRAPFNLTAARARLRLAHPGLRFGRDDPHARAWPPLAASATNSGQADYNAWEQEYNSIERGRFPLVKSVNDTHADWERHQHTAFLRDLGTLASKFVGLPDAFLHLVGVVRRMAGWARVVAVITFLVAALLVFNPAFSLGLPWRLLLWPVVASLFALALQAGGCLVAFLLPGIIPHPFFVASTGITHCFFCFGCAATRKLAEHRLAEAVIKRVG